MGTRETLTISLPPEMRQWIDTLVKDAGYASASEYLRELIRADRAKRDEARFSQDLRAIIARRDAAPATTKPVTEARDRPPSQPAPGG